MGDESRQWTKFGRYALLDKIGSGGMAEIYRAKTFGAAGFEKEYAIKLIIPSLVDDTEFVEMFINEAKIVVNLYHANIVQVFDLGEIDGQYYIAMEYVHGKDLLDILARCAKLNIKIPLNLVLFITMEMLKGLNFAHNAKDPYGEDLNIIHRDVSPSNILISYAGDVKVGDFGVAKAAIQRSLTQSDTLKGKVGYMSPEQVMGEEIDYRSDIFSAGIIFYEALSMSRLFVGNSDLDVMLKVRDAEIDDALERVRAIPSDLQQILRRALAKDPEDRYQSAGDFYQALVDFCYQRSIKVTGNDLSDMMNRLFAEEIEEEKSKRRVETNAPPPEAFESGAPASELSDLSELSEAEVEEPEAPNSDPSPDQIGIESTEIDDVSKHSERANADAPAVESSDEEVVAEEESTFDEPELAYEFRAPDGDLEGPFERDELIERLQNRIPHPKDRVRLNEGEWRRVESFEELAGHVPRYSDIDKDTERSIPVGARALHKRSSTDLEDGSVPPAPSTAVNDEDSSSPGIVADESLESNVRAMEEISVAFAKQRGDSDEELDDALEPGPFERKTPAAEEAPESLDQLETTPEEVDSITELKDQYASYEGELLEAPFPRLLGRLHLAGATGRLHVEHDSVEKSIFVRNGEPVLVDSSKKEELLGSFLLSRGIIDQEQLDQALARLHEWGGRLGDALVAIGAVPAHDIYGLLSEQMREKLLDIFTWRDGYYGYYENQQPDTKGYPLDIDTLQLVVEGCREYVPFGHLVDFYEDRMSVRIQSRASAPFDLDRLELEERERRVLDRISENSTLSELLDSFPSAQKSRVYRIVYLLQQLEVIEFEDTKERPLPDLEETSDVEPDEAPDADES